MIKGDIWTATAEEREIIGKIVERAEKRIGIDNRLSLLMDIEATHTNNYPLRLTDLLNAPDFDFVHDITGILFYMDRETGKLTGCFVPRFAQPEEDGE